MSGQIVVMQNKKKPEADFSIASGFF